MELVKVKLEGGSLPEYKHAGDAGADVRAIQNPVNESGRYTGQSSGNSAIVKKGGYFLAPGETKLISLGFRMAIPKGWEIQVRSRSGLAKRGIVVANSPGTIDSGYRGPCMVLLHNNTEEPYAIEANERIAQFVLKKAPQAMFASVDDLDATLRGDGGFGSTGKQ